MQRQSWPPPSLSPDRPTLQTFGQGSGSQVTRTVVVVDAAVVAAVAVVAARLNALRAEGVAGRRR